MALRFCERCVEMQPENVELLETKATILLELGQQEEAKVVSFYLYNIFC